MFDVLAYVYENESPSEVGPDSDRLVCQLNAVGFEADRITQALTWLRGLQAAASGLRDVDPIATLPARGLMRASAHSVRVYPGFEQRHLGAQCMELILFLDASGALPAHLRELVLERAMATPGAPLALDDLKCIVLMVYANLGFHPGALILDELCQGSAKPVLH